MNISKEEPLRAEMTFDWVEGDKLVRVVPNKQGVAIPVDYIHGVNGKIPVYEFVDIFGGGLIYKLPFNKVRLIL